MHRFLWPTLIAFAAGCASNEPAPTPPAPKKTAPAPAPKPAPKPAPAAEPDRITVSHILIMFAGSDRSSATRTQAEAEKLAKEILERARKGQDFGFMAKKHSDDPGGGTYTMVNNGVRPSNQNEYARKSMVPAFGDVGFKLNVGEVGFATYDRKSSPFGYHVIKRVK